MIIEFETALATDYIPKMIPGLKSVKFATEESAFYQDAHVTKYPSVLVHRDDSSPDFCQRYSVQDDQTLEYITLFPYIQPYLIRAFVEKQTEAVAVRDRIRLYHYRNPYVIFPYDEMSNFNIGLRMLRLSIETKRTNESEKGAQREVDCLLMANLVLKNTETIPSIEEVNVKLAAIYHERGSVFKKFKNFIFRSV